MNQISELDEYFKKLIDISTTNDENKDNNPLDSQDYYKIPTEFSDLTKIELKHPEKKKISNNHTLIINSEQRDYSLYPESNKYLVELYQPYKNVEQIELLAVMLPKTEYNVNTNNNIIKISINNGEYQYLSLTPGQYTIGTNVIGCEYSADATPFKTGLLAELNNKLNTIGNFKVILCTAPPPYGTGAYASVLNRIAIINTDSLSFSIDFTAKNSPYKLLGFSKRIVESGLNQIYGSSDGSCNSSLLLEDPPVYLDYTSVLSAYDYNLTDYPNYIVMELNIGKNGMSRNESLDKAINNKFCIILYDANDPDNIDTSILTKGYYDPVISRINRKAGNLKSMKGTDFDKKVIKFDPPVIIENLEIVFYKYNNELYDFHNREHLLTFDLITADFDPRYKY
jgi:hypothetical protein